MLLIITRTLKPSPVQKHTRLKICNTFTLPTLLHRCETWAIKEQDKSEITSTEMIENSKICGSRLQNQ